MTESWNERIMDMLKPIYPIKTSGATSPTHHKPTYTSQTYHKKHFVCLFDLGLTSLSTSFSHIETVSGCGRELNAPFYSAASLKYHAPDTLTRYSTKSHYTDTELTSSSSTFLMLSAKRKSSCRESNPQPPGHRADALPLSHCASH